MQLPAKPLFKVLLKPVFDDNGAATSLAITLTFQWPHVASGQVLLNHQLDSGNVPGYERRDDEVTAFDDAGSLPLTLVRGSQKGSSIQEWRVQRSTVGDVKLVFAAKPRTVDITTPIGPRVDLRKDQGGLQGAGQYFLPYPATEDRQYRNVVEWDLSAAPTGTRAVWTFGEGPQPVEKEGRPEIVRDSVYMVGPINSYPASRSTNSDSDYSAFYWFGELPENIANATDFNTKLFLKMASFFQNPAGPDSSYRVFTRKTLRGYGGTGFLASYVLEYDDETTHESEEGVASLLAHEMVHSWAILDAEENGDGNAWYIEGIANLYSAYLPYFFGLKSRQFLCDILNSYMVMYYTNPELDMPNREAEDGIFSSWYAEDIPYVRGCAYLLKVAALLYCASPEAVGAQASSPLAALDHIVVDLATRRRRRGAGNTHLGFEAWKSYLYPLIGAAATDELFDDQNTGRRRIDIDDVGILLRNLESQDDLPGSASINGGERMVLRPFEVCEYGFDRDSLNSRVVTGVVGGSRAELAGLRDGDKIVRTTRMGKAREAIDATIVMTVERDGQQLDIEFLPRGFKKQLCWQIYSPELAAREVERSR